MTLRAVGALERPLALGHLAANVRAGNMSSTARGGSRSLDLNHYTPARYKLMQGHRPGHSWHFIASSWSQFGTAKASAPRTDAWET